MNYKQFECLKNERIINSDVKIKGVTGTSTKATGKVELDLQLSPDKSSKVDALIVKDVNFGYNLILGRDVLRKAELNSKSGTMTLRGETIKFLDKEETKDRKAKNMELVAQTDCLVTELILQKKTEAKRKSGMPH